MNKASKIAAMDGLSASVQILPLPPGLYLFSVQSENHAQKVSDGQLRLPALHVGLGPGVSFEDVEFVAGPKTAGAWLFAHDDLVVAKVKGIGATLVLSSLRGMGGEVLSIKVERLDTRTDVLNSGALAAPAKSKVAAAAKADVNNVKVDGAVPLIIGAHVRSRGDMTFSDASWAGRVAPGLWIESFSIRPLEHFSANDIEYKGLTGSGYETAWLSDDEMCGTKGLSVPLVGFAVRLKPSALAASYNCEYSGYFKSGVTIGALQNGAPCRSTVANDPLEGIQIRIRKRESATAKPLAQLATRPFPSPARVRAGSASKGPKSSGKNRGNPPGKGAASRRTSRR